MPTIVLLADTGGTRHVRSGRGSPSVSLVQEAATLSEEERKRRIAYVIESTRRHRDISPPELARRVGRSRGTINDWEAGRSTPSLVDLGPLCVALGVKPDAFADLPAIPDDPLVAYLLPTAESGVEEGVRRGRRRRAASDPDTPARTLERPPRGNGAAHG
jgi:transcriptional regulator with XRE-family HTH domain